MQRCSILGAGALSFLLVLCSSYAASAQTVSLDRYTRDGDGYRFVIGQTITFSYAVPEDVAGLVIQAAIIKDDEPVDSVFLDAGASGEAAIDVPRSAGSYAFGVIVDGMIASSVPLQAVVTPVDGAIQVDRSRLLLNSAEIGQQITVAVNLPDNRYWNIPRVELYRVGGLNEGGAAFDDREVTGQFVNDRSELVFDAPSLPGAYEFRLIDQAADSPDIAYLLDRDAFRVTAGGDGLGPWADIDLSAQTFQAGQEIVATITLPPDRYYDLPWVGLYRDPSWIERPDANTLMQELLLDQQSLFLTVDGDPPLEGEQVTFTAPSEPGRYELRVFDRSRLYTPSYEIGGATFRVEIAADRDAMALPAGDFDIGQTMVVDLDLSNGEYYQDPWIGLYERSTGYEILLHSWSISSDENVLTFTSPTSPGDYYLRLFDRPSMPFTIDEEEFTVIPYWSRDSLALAERTVEAGSEMTLSYDMPVDRFYDDPQIVVFRTFEFFDIGHARREHLDPVLVQSVPFPPHEGEIVLTAPADPGDYQIYFFDRDRTRYGVKNSYAVDTIPFEVQVTRLAIGLQLPRSSYRAGEEIVLTANLPEGRVYDRPVIVFEGRVPGSDETGNIVPFEQFDELIIEDAVPGQLEWRIPAPAEPGDYRFRLLDRSGPDAYEIDWISLKVTVGAEDGLLALNGTYFNNPGDPISVRVTLPDHLPDSDIGNPVVRVVRQGYVSEGGAPVAEHPVLEQRFDEAGVLEFEAPDALGVYEVRFYDGNDDGFVLDMEPFRVIAVEGPRQWPPVFRFTPEPVAR